eukprot:TRINITY_DN74526_c0_g1_i1.p1 TRINITY_DN74526_c0_g1~~TRINITY_DN74526_c0_g1_i1.p1  ORF type:complete len:603 (+),score=171.61 TRINITY_DN74526_c0_g1_i1:39-1811(+)
MQPSRRPMSFARLASLILPIALLLQRCATVQAVTPVQGNNLDGLIQNPKLKFVFVGGKGGVGKTTTSSAIASQLSLAADAAKSNRRVLLISTDPAHSLSDAFRMKFSNVPTPIMPDLPNLEVMEVNPADTMKHDLEEWAALAKELGYDPAAEDGGEGDGLGIGSKIHGFQEWLSGVPGIDEATALSSAIEHIESGRYDMIVFDTAPTGHTLKLLELPKILQAGIEKLESWQGTLWGYWELIKGFTSGSADSGNVKEKLAAKLKTYKASLGRVSDMITNREKTRFVVVCIAEYLSISESRRLLSELDRFDVLASHVVVNQLVTDYLEEDEMQELEDVYSKTKAPVLEKAIAAARLTTARRNIQSKYLKDLKECPEVNRKTDPLTVLEVPLLPSEVTGSKAIMSFSNLLVGKDLAGKSQASIGVESERSKKARADAKEKPKQAAKEPKGGAKKSAAEDAMKNMMKGLGGQGGGLDDLMKGLGGGKGGGLDDIVSKIKTFAAEITGDPEIKALLKEKPALKSVLKKVQDNPMSAMQYMGSKDKDIQKLISVVMGKAKQHPEMAALANMAGSLGNLGGSGKRRKRRRSQGASEL